MMDAIPKYISSFHYDNDISLEKDSILLFLKEQNASHENHFIKGETEKNQIWWAISWKEEKWNHWIQNIEKRKYSFSDFTIYWIEDGNKKYRFSFMDDWVFISEIGYLVEESLLCFQGENKGLSHSYPDLKNLEVGQSFSKLNDIILLRKHSFPRFSFMDEHLITQKNEHKINGSFLSGKLPEISYQKQWKKILSVLPQQIDGLTIHSYKRNSMEFSEFEKLIHSPTTNLHANFFMETPFQNQFSYSIIDVGRPASEVFHELKEKIPLIDESSDSLFPYIRLAYPNTCKEFRQMPFLDCHAQPYIWGIDNYILMANNKEAMQRYLDAILAGNTWAENEYYLTSLQQGNFEDILSGTLAFISIDREQDLFFEIKLKDKTYQLNGVFTKNNIRKIDNSSAQIIWREELQGEALITPQFILYDTDLQFFRVAVQDEYFYLYIFDESGKVISRKRLEGKIISDIQYCFQTEDGDRWYLFNTKNKIHFINEKGKEHSNFPIDLNSPASNDVQYVYYRNQSSHFAFVACENNNYYGFDLTRKGKPLENWNPLRGVGSPEVPLSFWQGKDQADLVFINNKKEVVVLDREAQERFPPIPLEEEFTEKIFLDHHHDAERIVLHNGKGRLKIINKKGEVFHLILSEEKEGIFIFSDVVGDERKDYIFYSENKLSVHSYQKDTFQKVLQKNIKENINSITANDLQFEKSFIQLQYQGKIDAINGSGQRINGFPLQGESLYHVTENIHGSHCITTMVGNHVFVYLLKTESN